MIENTPPQEVSFDLPKEDIVIDTPDSSQDIPTDEVLNEPESPAEETQATQEVLEETATIPEEVVSEDENITTEDNTKTPDDSIPTPSVTESQTDNIHDLQELYTEFKEAFNTYSKFKNDTSVTLTGLRTDEAEINYVFNHKENNIIAVTKSNTSDTLTFEETESGIKTYINEDMI